MKVSRLWAVSADALRLTCCTFLFTPSIAIADGEFTVKCRVCWKGPPKVVNEMHVQGLKNGRCNKGALPNQETYTFFFGSPVGYWVVGDYNSFKKPRIKNPGKLMVTPNLIYIPQYEHLGDPANRKITINRITGEYSASVDNNMPSWEGACEGHPLILPEAQPKAKF